MASVQTSGLNLDVQSLATQLVAADRATEDARNQRQEKSLTVQLSGLSTLKGALSAFQSALTPLKTVGAFAVRSAAVSDDTYFTATADSTSAPGNYDIQVVDLAKANQLASAPFLTPDATLGTGTLTIGQGSSSFDVTIDSTNNTLSGVRDAINKNANNTGVQATLIHESNGTHLVLTSNKTGAAGALSVSTAGGDGGLNQLVYNPANGGTKHLTQLQPAQDAHITIAGYDHYSSTNTVTDAIDGVTLTLKAKTPDATPAELTVSTDNAGIADNVQKFVDAFNSLQKTFASLRSFNSSTGATGALFGDALLGQVENQTRLDLSNAVSGLPDGYNSLAAIGITRQTDGSLAVNSTKLTAAVNNGNGAVAQLFGSTNGIAARLSSHIDTQLATGAAFDYRNTSLQAGLKDVADAKSALDARMVLAQARYVQQFSALDAMLSNMKQTSDYLAKQLA